MLQQLIGNRRLSSVLRAPVQRDEVDTAAGFDPRAVRNELIRAIDVTPIAFIVLGELRYLPRSIKTAKVVTALDNKTASQVAAIRQAYSEHEHRTLDHDLFAPDQGGTDLKQAERAQIAALLKGTTADLTAPPIAPPSVLTSLGMSEETAASVTQSFAVAAAQMSQGAADAARAEATAAQLRGLLTEKPNESEREQIMQLLRNDAPRNGSIAGAYRQQFTADLYADLRTYLEPKDADRAEKLVVGDRVAADALALQQRLERIAAMNAQISALQAELDDTSTGGEILAAISNSSAVIEAMKEKLEASRREQVAAAEQVLENARQEAARDADPAHRLTAGAARVREIMGQKTGGGAALGEAAAAALPVDAQHVLAAMSSAEPGTMAPDLVAARMYQAVGTAALNGDYVESELRGLRTQAQADARADALAKLSQLAPTLSGEDRQAAAASMEVALPGAVTATTEAYFTRLRQTYSTMLPGRDGGSSFDQLLTRFDTADHVDKLVKLFQGRGALSDLDELKNALGGDRHDMATVKRVLSGKDGQQVRELVAAFDAQSPRPLTHVLFGEPLPVAAAALAPAATLMSSMGGIIDAKYRGKATGHDAFVLRELLGTPEVLAGSDEAEYLAGQTAKESAWAIKDSGTWGAIYDATGNETRDLMENTSTEAATDLRLYRSLLAAGRTAEAAHTLQELRRDRARMKGDRAAYSDSIQKFKAQLASALTMAVDVAIMVCLPASAPFLLGVAVTAAGHVAANLIVYGDEYSGDMLQKDLLSAIGAAAGSKLAGLALAGQAAGSGARIAMDLAEQTAIASSRTIAREASGYASESVLALAKRETIALGKEIVENAAGDVGGQLASTGDVHAPSASGIALGVVQGRVGRALKGGPKPATPEQHPDSTTDHASGSGAQSPGGHASTPAEHDGSPQHPVEPEHPTPAEPGHPVDDVHTRPTATHEAVPEPAEPATRKSADATDPNIRDPLHDFEVEKTQVDRIRQGRALQVADPADWAESWRLYQKVRTLDPLREVGLMYNRTLDHWAVVQGGATETAFGAAARQLGWKMADMDVVRHVHPVDAKTGATADRNVLASGRGGDLSGIAKDAARGDASRARAWEAIDVMVDRGPGRPPSADRTWVLYDRQTHLWTIDFPLSGPNGGRDRVSSINIEGYHRWYRQRFGKNPGASLPKDPAARTAALETEVGEGYRESAQRSDEAFAAQAKDLLEKASRASMKLDQTRSALPADQQESAELLADMKRRVDAIAVEARVDTDPAGAETRMAQAKALVAEVDHVLGRLPTLTRIWAQRRAWSKQPQLAESLRLLTEIDGRLRQGEMTATEGRQAFERLRQATPAPTGSAPVTTPDLGVVLSGDIGLPKGWRVEPMSYAQARQRKAAGVPVLPPDAVIKFPHGYAWLDPTGDVVAHAKLGASLGRKHRQRLGVQSDYARDNPRAKTGFTSEIAHLLGPGTGFESPTGAAHAPQAINQRLQNWGIESALRRYFADSHSGKSQRAVAWRAELAAKGLTAPDLEITARMGYSADHPGYLDHVRYTVTAVGNGSPTLLFEVGIHVDYAGPDAATGVNGRIVLTVEPLAPAGEFGWVRDELESARFRTLILDERKKLDAPGWEVSGGEQY